MQQYTTIAIGKNNEADLWCEIVEAEPGEDPAGVHFRVINGGWNGQIKGGKLHVKGFPEMTREAEILWVGDLPGLKDRYDYNEALKLVNQKPEEKSRPSTSIPTGLLIGTLAIGFLAATKKARKYEKQEFRS